MTQSDETLTRLPPNSPLSPATPRQGERERLAAFLDTTLGVPYEPAVPPEATSQYVPPRARGLDIE